MNELDKLRPDVSDALRKLNGALWQHEFQPEWETIRAELVRLANENTYLQLRKEVDIEQSVEDHKWHSDERPDCGSEQKRPRPSLRRCGERTRSFASLQR